MGLKILRESDPVEVTQLTVCIYSPPGIGKSSLGFTADEPFLIDFDKGMHRAANRKTGGQPGSWGDVEEIRSLLAPHKTVIVDTAGRALDMLTTEILESDPKAGKGGTLSIQGYGILKGRFIGWLNMVKSMGKDVVLLCHSDEKQKGEETIERLDVQGGSKNEIYKSADVMGRLGIKNGKRVLNFNPTDTAFGKNPGNWAEMEFKHPSEDPSFLGRVIRETKERINAQSESQQEAAAYLFAWKAKIDACLTPTDFNKTLKELLAEKTSEANLQLLKRMLNDEAGKKNMAYDVKGKAFALKEVAA